MSLTGNQVRDLQSLYESIYSPKKLKEDVILTKEEFEELCEYILEEAFGAISLDEGMKAKAFSLLKKGAQKLFMPTTAKGQAVRLGGVGTVAGIEGATGGKGTRTVGAITNPKNLYGYVKGMFQAVDKNMQGAGQILKDKEKGTYYTTDQASKKNLKNSFEFDNFNLHIVEDAKSLEDLTKELNKQKDKKDNTNINTNIKDNTPKTDTPKVDTPKVDTPKNDTPKVDTPKTDTPKVDTPKTDTPKVDTSKVDTSKEIESSEAEFKANEGEKFNQYQKDKINKKKADEKKHADAKKKDKLLSTHIPVVSKTKLGSTVRPVKPGSSRDKMIAKNELRHGSDKIVKKREMNADFQRMKKGEITKMDFMKQYPNSQTTKKYNMKQIDRGKQPIRSQYEPYDFVLDYVLSEGHASTLEEAHYVMMQMSQDTIQNIVSEYENV